MNIDEMKDRIARAEEIQRYTENRCEALKKENAELRDNYENFKAIAEPEIKSLKEENATLRESLDYANLTNAEFASDLTKAKDLLKWFVWYFREGSPNLVPYKHKVTEAEQFIKE